MDSQIDLGRVSSLLGQWRAKMSKPGERNRALKRPYSPSPRPGDRVSACIARRPATSSVSAQTSGSLSTSLARRRSPRTARTVPKELHRLPPVSTDWQSPLFSWDKVATMFNLPTDRYEDFKFLTYLDISDPFVKNYVHYNLGLEDPKITGRLKAHSHFYRTLNAPKNVQDIVEHGFFSPYK